MKICYLLVKTTANYACAECLIVVKKSIKFGNYVQEKTYLDLFKNFY